MSMRDLKNVTWIKSSYSSGDGQCVEVAALATEVAVRDSKDKAGPVLTFTRRSWATFLARTTAGDPTP